MGRSSTRGGRSRVHSRDRALGDRAILIGQKWSCILRFGRSSTILQAASSRCWAVAGVDSTVTVGPEVREDVDTLDSTLTRRTTVVSQRARSGYPDRDRSELVVTADHLFSELDRR